jgi:uncharacterized membrane protein
MSQRRLGYIDQFRGLATVFMIETHVLNALLLTSLRGDFTFKAVDFLNGLVAPSFLFVAGFSFTLALSRKGDAYRKFSPELLRHLKRLLFIWAVGYVLHIPFFSLRKSLYETSPAGVLVFTGVDILQCIAATLFLLHILRVLIKDDRKFNIVLYSLFMLFILAAPLAGSVDLTNSLPLWLAQYFNRMHGSLFPLFPWSSFLIGGTIASLFIMNHSDSAGAGRMGNAALKTILRTAVGAVALGVIFTAIEKHFNVEPHFADYSPSWFVLRFGFLLLILYGVSKYEEKRRSEFSAMKLFGRESFFVYAVHLVIVYGSFARLPSLAQMVGPGLGYAGCLGIFALLTIVMYFVATGWSDLKRNNYDISRQVQAGFIAVVLYLFISRPY